MRAETVALLDALDLLRDEGWIQGEYHDSHRGYCIAGAIGYVTEETRARYSLRASLVDLLHRAILDLHPGWCVHHQCASPYVPWFNDAPGRTFAEVEKVMLHAVELAEVLP